MTTRQAPAELALYPQGAAVRDGHLIIGGCDAVALAGEYGTPLYVFDEMHLRNLCRAFKKEFTRCYPETTVCYSAKAFTLGAMLRLVKEEGLDIDVVSGGEMGIARSVDFPMERVHFPGNNKSSEELEMAVGWGIGHIVVDNPTELEMLKKITGGRKARILLRLSPGIDPHTHRYNTTGIVDSKFGFTRSTWEQAIIDAMASPDLDLDGLHFHLGSGIFEMEPYEQALRVVLEFAAQMKERHGFDMKTLSVGGGYGVRYALDEEPPAIAAWAEKISGDLAAKCRELKLALPRLMIEPGRAIVALAGVALYTAGVIKDIPGVRCYVSVDGGMGDNIRPALYGAKHGAMAANKMMAEKSRKVTIAGKYCESGDILVTDAELPPLAAGDTIALAGCGAYCVPMQSNYNTAFRPAVVMVRDGKARLIRRRETLEDLTRCEVL